MFKKILPFLGVLALPLISEGYLTPSPYLSLWGEGVFFRRSEGNAHQLVMDRSRGVLDQCNRCNFNKGCSSQDLIKKFDYEPGYRVGISYITPYKSVEAFYLWVQPWESRCSIRQPSLIFFSKKNRFSSGFSQADEGFSEYQCHFQNGELNYYGWFGPRTGNFFSFALLGGGRYISLKEALLIRFQKGPFISTYNIHTRNEIGCVQIGSSIGWNPSSHIHWEIKGKVGVGVDVCSQKTDLRDLAHVTIIPLDPVEIPLSDVGILRFYKKKGIATPLLAEVELFLGYQIAKWLECHVAYQVIYLNGVALAPDQISKSLNTEQILKKNGAPLFHGWIGGISIEF